MNNTEVLWNEFKELSYPATAHLDAFELEACDSSLAGMVSSAIAGADFDADEARRRIDDISSALPHLDTDAKSYFQKLIELGEALLAEK